MKRISSKFVPTQPTSAQRTCTSPEVSHSMSGMAGRIRRGTITPVGIPVEISYQVMPRANKAGYLYQIGLTGENKAVIASHYIFESRAQSRKGTLHTAVATSYTDTPVSAVVWFRNGNDDVFKINIEFDPKGHPELKEAVRGDGQGLV